MRSTPEDDVAVGTPVRRVNSDYRFDGTVVAAFAKLSGEVRYVVEDDRGILFVWKRENFEVRDGPDNWAEYYKVLKMVSRFTGACMAHGVTDCITCSPEKEEESNHV